MSDSPEMKPSPRRAAPRAAATSRPIEGFSVTINLIMGRGVNRNKNVNREP